jgi:hypothetical protein
MYILQGPPGCGKSSFSKAIVEMLLHESHAVVHTDVERLKDQFNGHAGENILTVLEEVSVNDLQDKGMRQLQELVTCSYRYERRLFKEGSTIRDFRRFLVNTNSPSVRLPNQRRIVLARFSHEIAQLLEQNSYREWYLSTLDRVLNSELVMKRFAHFLLRRYHTVEMRAAYNLQVHTLRTFNFDTVEMQLETLKDSAETSVLGWLYEHLTKLDDFFAERGQEVYAVPSTRAGANDNDICQWQCLAELCNGALPPNGFTGRWRDTSDDVSLSYEDKCAIRRRRTSCYWTRARASKFYESYCQVVSERNRLSERDFADKCRMIFGATNPEFNDNHESVVYMLESTTRENNRTHEVWALAPLEMLEQVFISAVPNVQELDWDKFRLERQIRRDRNKIHVRLVRSSVGQ